MDRTFAIVKFVDEDDCRGVVLSKWITGDEQFCYYPNVKTDDKRDKLLKQEAEYSTDWGLHPIAVMRYYDTFSEARLNLKKAEDTSNLESTSDEEIRKKQRSVKRKKHFRLPGEDENSSNDEDDNELKKRETTPTARPSRKSPPYPSLSSFSPISSTLQPKTSRPIYNHSIITHSKTQSFLKPSHLKFQSPDRSPSPSVSFQTTPTRSAASFFDGDRLVLGQLQATVADLCEKVSLIDNRTKSLETKIDFLISKLSPENLETANSTAAELFAILPLKSHEEFEHFETSLLEDNFARQFVQLLVSVGGKDFKANIGNIMRRVMVCELGMEFSYSGKSMGVTSKLTFANTKICKCIQRCLQKTYSEQATETAIKVAIGHWLQQSKARVNRRKVQPQDEDRG